MPTALLSRKYMPDPGTSSYITAAALMEFFFFESCLCPIALGLLPSVCISIFLSITFSFRWFNGFLVVPRLRLRHG